MRRRDKPSVPLSDRNSSTEEGLTFKAGLSCMESVRQLLSWFDGWLVGRSVDLFVGWSVGRLVDSLRR